jgi:lipoate---protein ligase
MDESLLRSLQEDGPETVRIWINRRAVVLGRSQSATAEVDLVAADRAGVPVLRRVSGGGTVFHYPGNLNVSVFLHGQGLPGVEAMFAWLGGALASALSTSATRLVADDHGIYGRGLKIGGAAQLRRASAVLYHTTLLLQPSHLGMSDLLRALRPGYRPENVPSRPRAMSTLSDLRGHEVDVREVGRSIVQSLAAAFQRRLCPGAPTDEESARAERLVREKYGCSRWNLRM